MTTHNLSGTLDGLALLDETVRAEKHDTDLAGLEVHAHALDARREPVSGQTLLEIRWENFGNLLDKLLSLDIGHAMHTGNTVTVE